MQTALNLASRRRDKVVILTGPAIGAECSTYHFPGIAKMMSGCARALFSPNMSTMVAVVCLAAMWWHNLTIGDVVAAQQAVATDALCAAPWAAVWIARLTFKPSTRKGGAQ